jgi:GAF domain-containing protein/sugar diacid utilization regulator
VTGTPARHLPPTTAQATPSASDGLTQLLHLLRLLAEEAPDAAFTNWLSQCSAVDGAGLGETVIEGYELARRIRDNNARRERRESALAALYATAGDLSSLRDTDKVLTAIVRRARELLVSDVAYITLIDESTGVTSMRIEVGMVTSALRQMRLEHGTGVSGLVAKTAEPFWTPNYLDDRRIIHVIVAEEGLSAVLGVPLLLGDQALGVLFAAHRRPRSFSAEEVALLSSLGHHAAIALHNARMFEASRAALEELTEAHTAMKAHAELVEKSAMVHDRLADLILQGSEMAGVVDALAEVLTADILVLGTDNGELARSAAMSTGTHAELLTLVAAGDSDDPAAAGRWDEIRTEVFRRGRSTRCPVRPGEQDVWITPVIAGAEQFAVSLATRREEFGDAELRTLERAAQVTALLLLMSRSVAAAEQAVRGDLLDDLLSSYPIDEAGLRRRAELLGLDLDRCSVVATARPVSPTGRSAVLQAVGALSRELGGLAGEHAGSVVALLPGNDPKQATVRISDRLAQVGSPKATIGAAGPAVGLRGLAQAYQDAARCERILLALDRAGASATPRDLGIYGLLFSGAPRHEIEAFLDDRLGPLLRYDAEHATDLLSTLSAYFDASGNIAKAAHALYLHTNTMRQRLARVRELLADGWKEETQLELQVAVRIHRIIRDI